VTAYLAHPLLVFLSVWGVTVTLYLAGVSAGTFPAPQALLGGVLLLNVVAFCLGYLTWSLFQALTPQRNEPPSIPARPLALRRMRQALAFTLLMGVAALALELYRVALLAAHFQIDWLYLVTHPSLYRLRLVLFIGSDVFQASSVVMLLSLTSALFSLGLVLLGASLYLDPTRWKYVYLAAFLLVSLVIGVLHLSRYEVTTNILYVVLAYCFLHARDYAADARDRRSLLAENARAGPARPARAFSTPYIKLLIPVATVALLFLIVELLLHKSAAYDPDNRLQGFFFHLYWYLASPLAALNEFLATFTGDHSLGRNTFFPFYKWLCRFHLATEVEVSIYGEKLFLPYLANTYTYLRTFYEDFGLCGVALGPYLFGTILAALRRYAGRSFAGLNLFLVLLVAILLSFYNFFLTSNQVYLQILFGFLFFRFEMKTTDELPQRA